MVICLERGADLHIAQLMPLPSLSLASVKSRLVLPFWYRLTWVVPEKGPLNGCVCVCVLSLLSVLWHCWLGIWKSIQPVKKFSDEVLVRLSVWSEVQIVCIWSSWCRPKTPSSLASFKSRLVLPFWYWLTWVVLEKRPLNGSTSSSSSSSCLGQSV